jgi:DNA-binding beta-propeller fold protein YncE
MRYPVRWLMIFTMLLGLGIVLGGCEGGSAPTSAPAPNTSVPPAQPTAAAAQPTAVAPLAATTAPPASAPSVAPATAAPTAAAASHGPTHSSPIAVTSDDATLLVVNPLNNSISIVNVKGDANQKVAEVAVGVEPQSVAISNDDKFAYVTNQGSQSVSLLRTLTSRHPVCLTTRRLGGVKEILRCAQKDNS